MEINIAWREGRREGRLFKKLTPPLLALISLPPKQFKDDFRVRLGLPPPSSSSLPSLPPSLPSSSDPPARRARTQVQVLGYGLCEGKEVTKLLLRPISGRRHQLRVHCLYVGHPIGEERGRVGGREGGRTQKVSCLNQFCTFELTNLPPSFPPSLPPVGDSTYGGDTTSPRMMLHALALTLPFPAGKVPSTPFAPSLPPPPPSPFAPCSTPFLPTLTLPSLPPSLPPSLRARARR